MSSHEFSSCVLINRASKVGKADAGGTATVKHFGPGLEDGKAYQGVRYHFCAVPSQHPKIQTIPEHLDGQYRAQNRPQEETNAKKLQNEQNVASKAHHNASLVDCQEEGVDLQGKAGESQNTILSNFDKLFESQ